MMMYYFNLGVTHNFRSNKNLITQPTTTLERKELGWFVTNFKICKLIRGKKLENKKHNFIGSRKNPFERRGTKPHGKGLYITNPNPFLSIIFTITTSFRPHLPNNSKIIHIFFNITNKSHNQGCCIPKIHLHGLNFHHILSIKYEKLLNIYIYICDTTISN